MFDISNEHLNMSSEQTSVDITKLPPNVMILLLESYSKTILFAESTSRANNSLIQILNNSLVDREKKIVDLEQQIEKLSTQVADLSIQLKKQDNLL